MFGLGVIVGVVLTFILAGIYGSAQKDNNEEDDD